MKTPIVDFVARYAEKGVARFHMPGHKGASFLGCEALDITEVAGADDLHTAEGIILESERNASALFGTAHSFYSTEGSTLCIKAMLALATLGLPKGRRPLILAARNAHKAFLYAVAMLDLDVEWIDLPADSHLCGCQVTAEEIARMLETMPQAPDAVYLTSPDYLGKLADVAGISRVCQANGIPLLVDNAHGAYLQFLSPSMHPIALGATICCDSAHKTLPVLTGGAYLHISKAADATILQAARDRLALFASTSPSYLILQSLDLCNSYLVEGYAEKLACFIDKVERVKRKLADFGFWVEESEPLKLVIRTTRSGYTGESLAEGLRKEGIEVELADTEYLVLMLSPENTDAELERLVDALGKIEQREAIETALVPILREESRMTVREAMLADCETLPTELAEGRICATPTVSCPPAIPIAISGEVITERSVKALLAYGITSVKVVRE